MFALYLLSNGTWQLKVIHLSLLRAKNNVLTIHTFASTIDIQVPYTVLSVGTSNAIVGWFLSHHLHSMDLTRTAPTAESAWKAPSEPLLSLLCPSSNVLPVELPSLSEPGKNP